MILVPDASSAILDPFTEVPTLSLVCEIAEPITLAPYAKDPRRVAKRAEEYLRSTGVADTCYLGPECEFFVFDDVSYAEAPNESRYRVDSAEGHRRWRSHIQACTAFGPSPKRVGSPPTSFSETSRL